MGNRKRPRIDQRRGAGGAGDRKRITLWIWRSAYLPASRRPGVEDQCGKLGGNADSGCHHRGRRAGRAGRGHRGQAGRARLLDHREGRARQFHLQVSGEHGVLHHAGAARDWRPAAGVAVRETDAHRSAALLPARGRYLRAGDRVRRAGHSGRARGRRRLTRPRRLRDNHASTGQPASQARTRFLPSRRDPTKACAGSGTAAM